MRKTLLSLAIGCTACALYAQPLPQGLLPQLSPQKAHIIRQSTAANRIALLQAGAKPVETRSLPNGAQIVTYATPNGGCFKSLVKPAINRITWNTHSNKRINRAPGSEPTLYEGFESWNGTTPDYLPEAWSEIVSTNEIQSLNEGRFTWHVTIPQSVNPTEGKYTAAIYYAEKPDPNDPDGKKKIDLPQDEWLITPVFTPKDNENLFFELGYSPLFLFDLRNDYVDWGNMQFIERKPSTTLKLMVRPEGGEWVELYDVYNEWKDKELDLLYNMGFGMMFYSFNLPLDVYKGQNIQVAFRFVGQYGNTMYLDGVGVGQKALPTAYLWPEGSFYWAYSNKMTRLADAEGKGFMLVPPYQDITWKNTSDPQTETFEWQYANPESGWDYLTTNTTDLTVNYPYGAYAIPILTSQATGYGKGTYQWKGLSFQAGGTGIYPAADGTLTDYGMSNFDPTLPMVSTNDMNNGPMFGHHAKSRETWSGLFGQTDGNWAEIDGVGNVIPPSPSPYAISRVRMHAVGEVAPDALLQATVMTINSKGELTDTLAFGTCLGKDAVSTNNALTFDFVLGKADNEGNFVPQYVTVNTPIMVAVNGFAGNDKLKNLGVLHTQRRQGDTGSNSFAFVQFYMDGKNMLSPYPTHLFRNESGPYYTDFLITVDATYNWMFADTQKLTAKAAGDKLSTTLNYYLTLWNAVALNADGSVTDWVTLTTDVEGKQLHIDVEPQTSNASERSCRIMLVAPGSTAEIELIQEAETTGIEQQNCETERAYKQGQNLVVESNVEQKAGLYDASGRLLKQFNVKGHTLCPIAQYPEGVYLVRLDNGRIFKLSL